MKQRNEWKILVSYGIIVGSITILLGLLFIFECADIYYSGAENGGDIFSYEIVSQRMKLLLIPSAFWIVSIIVGYIVSAIIPRLKKSKQQADKITSVKLLKSKMPIGTSEEYKAEQKKLKKIETARIVIWSICSAIALVASIISIAYLSDLSHFRGLHVNDEILLMLRNILPWIVIAFVLFVVAVVFECVIAKIELNIIRTLYVLGQGGTSKEEAKAKFLIKKFRSFFISKEFIYTTRLVIVAVAVVFIVLGILNGGKDDVLMKAINICTECIGLG